jgi:ketosteroid isomerase-like protein
MNTVEIATKKVLMHHLTSFGNNNLEEIMLDYTEESILLCNKGTLKGLDKIRQFLKEMFNLIPSGSEFEMKQLTISDKVAHIIWTSKSAIAEIPFGTDTFLIEDDKIKVHTVAALVI